MSKRVQGVLIGVVVGAFLAGGVAYAVTVVPPNDTDRYYACVSTTGKVRYGTMKLNVQPTTCPNATDTVRSWNAQGPQGPKGDPGEPGPPGSGGTGIVDSQTIEGPVVTLNSEVNASLYVPCPDGTTVLSGGFAHGGTPGGTDVTRSAPDGSGWRIDLYNTPAYTTAQGYAVCGQKADQAITTGSLWAWGYGRLGNSPLNRQQSNIAVQIAGAKWKSAAVGYDHTAAVLNNGTLWTWGDNDFGQLGTGDTTLRNTPVQIGTDVWKTVTAHRYHSAAIRDDGSLWAWGKNEFGELGDGTTTNRSAPVRVGTDTWTAVSVGYDNTLAVRSDGTLWTWGRNPCGPDGTCPFSSTNPIQIGTNTWKAISTSGSLSYGIRTDGTLWVWGSNEATDGLGNGSGGIYSEPVQIGSSHWKSVSTYSGIHTMAIRQDDTLWAWGYSDSVNGYLGDGGSTLRSTPVQIGTGTWRIVRAGYNHTVGIGGDGTLWSWGYNRTGQCGCGTIDSPKSPVKIDPSTGWIAVAPGLDYSMAVQAP